MIVEPVSLLLAVIVVVASVIAMILFFILAVLAFAETMSGKKIAGMTLMGASILVLILLITVVQTVPDGTLGIDQNGNWYKPGLHLLPPSIAKVPLAGSVAISPNKDLAYNLTQDEVILLASGSHFPEYLREEIIIRYDKWGISLENVPAGIDSSHLKVVASFNPVFFISRTFSPTRTRSIFLY